MNASSSEQRSSTSMETAEENKKDHPEAAEVLTNNSCMDDIFGSVDTVAQAQKLTEDLDKLLESGGFGVKGWTSNKVLWT